MKKLLPFILIAAFLLAACGVNSRAEAPMAPDVYYNFDAVGSGGEQAPAMDMPASAPMPTAGVYEESDSGVVARDGSTNVAAAQVERMVIQNADLAIIVADVEARAKVIGDMAESMGGFVVSSNMYQSYTNDGTLVPESTVVIRVPSEKLEEALKLIKADVVEVQSENRSGQDVTAEYVDLTSRLKNLVIYFYQDFANFLINFVIFTLPALITIAIPLYLIFLGVRAIYRRVRANRKTEEPVVVVEEKKKK
jgi:hypothetical protein